MPPGVGGDGDGGGRARQIMNEWTRSGGNPGDARSRDAGEPPAYHYMPAITRSIIRRNTGAYPGGGVEQDRYRRRPSFERARIPGADRRMSAGGGGAGCGDLIYPALEFPNICWWSPPAVRRAVRRGHSAVARAQETSGDDGDRRVC